MTKETFSPIQELVPWCPRQGLDGTRKVVIAQQYFNWPNFAMIGQIIFLSLSVQPEIVKSTLTVSSVIYYWRIARLPYIFRVFDPLESLVTR